MYQPCDTPSQLAEVLPAELSLVTAPAGLAPLTHIVIETASSLAVAYAGPNVSGAPSLFPSLSTPPAEAVPFTDIVSLMPRAGLYELTDVSDGVCTLRPRPMPMAARSGDRPPRPPAVSADGRPVEIREGVPSSQYPLVHIVYSDDKAPVVKGIDLYAAERWLSDSHILVRYKEPYVWVRDRHMDIAEDIYGYVKHACMYAAEQGGAGSWIPSERSVSAVIASVIKDSSYAAPDPCEEDMARYAFFRNGMLDLGTLSLLPATEDVFHTNVLDADYDAEAQCPEMQQWFDMLLPDREAQRLFFEYAGYTLYHRRNDGRAFIVLTGIAGGGKSWAMNAVASCFGTAEDGSVAQMSVKDLGEKFKKWKLRDASMLIVDEIDMNQSKTGWLGSDDLKNWSAGGDVSAEKKGVDTFEFPCRTKFWFASNHSPVFGSDSGVWDRYKVLSFDHPVPKPVGRRMYAALKDRRARTWLAMKALDAYLDLAERDMRWTEPAGAMEVKREIMANGDTFNQWATALSDGGEFADFPDGTPLDILLTRYLYDKPCQSVYADYRDFVRDLYGPSGPVMSPGNFASRLRIEYGLVSHQYRVNGARVRSYRRADGTCPCPPGRVA